MTDLVFIDQFYIECDKINYELHNSFCILVNFMMSAFMIC